MSSHSECNSNGCPHCVGDGWTEFARALLKMAQYREIPLSIRAEIEKNAADKLELEEETA